MSYRFQQRIAVRLASLALLAMTAATGAETPVKPKGALEFTAENSLAVEAYQFTTVEVPFKVRNTGKKPVKILDIKPRRGSGRGTAEPAVLAPGESGRVVLRRQITDLGIRHYGFEVKTDEAASPDYPLKTNIFGLSAYTPDVPVILFETARFGQVAALRITVTSYETDQLGLKSVLSKPDWVDIAVVERAAGESSQEMVLEARLRATTPRGLNRGSIHLLTTAAGQPDLVIPVVARVFDNVSATPVPATMKPAQIGETRDFEIVYRALDDRTLALEDVVDSTGTLKLVSSSCGSQCVKVKGIYKTTAPGEVGGKLTARFVGRPEPLDVGWDVLVVPKGSVIHDLGVLGDDALDVDGDAVPVGAKP